MQEDAYAGWVATLLPLKDRAFTLALAGAVTIDNRPALGVRVSSKGHRDVALFFDKETGLLVKIETRSKGDSGEEATIETFVSGYKTVRDTKKFAVKRGGRPYLTWEVIDYRPAEGSVDGMFAKP